MAHAFLSMNRVQGDVSGRSDWVALRQYTLRERRSSLRAREESRWRLMAKAWPVAP